MDWPALSYIFNLCILLGLAIPVLNIATGWFGNFFDFDVDIDGPSGGFLPFNLMCLCLLLVVFGAAGHMLSRWMDGLWPTVLLLTLALALGALFYALLYKLVITPLKRNRPYSVTYAELCGQRGEVTIRITRESLGAISVRDNTGTFLSFRAKIDPDLAARMPATIPAGEIVVVTEVDAKEKLCYVSILAERFTQVLN